MIPQTLLLPVIKDFIKATIDYNSDAFIATFAKDALVKDFENKYILVSNFIEFKETKED